MRAHEFGVGMAKTTCFEFKPDAIPQKKVSDLPALFYFKANFDEFVLTEGLSHNGSSVSLIYFIVLPVCMDTKLHHFHTWQIFVKPSASIFVPNIGVHTIRTSSVLTSTTLREHRYNKICLKSRDDTTGSHNYAKVILHHYHDFVRFN